MGSEMCIRDRRLSSVPPLVPKPWPKCSTAGQQLQRTRRGSARRFRHGLERPTALRASPWSYADAAGEDESRAELAAAESSTPACPDRAIGSLSMGVHRHPRRVRRARANCPEDRRGPHATRGQFGRRCPARRRRPRRRRSAGSRGGCAGTCQPFAGTVFNLDRIPSLFSAGPVRRLARDGTASVIARTADFRMTKQTGPQ